MNKRMLALVSVVGLLIPLEAPAQGTLYVSNLGQTPTTFAAVGSDSWIAQAIITGTNSGGYILDSVDLLMDAASGSAGGFSVSMYSSLNGSPYINLGNLVGLDPSTGGVFNYTSSSLELSPSALYYVVVTSSTPIATGAYNWSATYGGPQSGIDGWHIFGVYQGSVDGISWLYSRQNTFQIAIYATTVPEPSTLALAGLGLAAIGFWRFRQGK